MRKTKIICTLGPSTDDPKILEAMMDSGMDVARFNFSHGTHAEHKVGLELLKKLRKEKNLPVAGRRRTSPVWCRTADPSRTGRA